jgi:hypothetical protein
MFADRTMATRYGALAGAAVGVAASGVVLAAYLYLARWCGPTNNNGALAGALLLSGVAGFPGSLAALALAERFGVYDPHVMRLGVVVMPVANWLVLGTGAGLAVDLGRSVGRWWRRGG